MAKSARAGGVETRLSPREYAKRKGVTRQAVMKAIRAGRLEDSVAKTDSGRYRIEPELADREWQEWTDPSQVREVKGGGRPPRTASLFDDEALREQRTTHARASAERVSIDAALKRLELEERQGLLVDRQAVTRIGFAIGRDTRERILAIPDRLAAVLHAAGSVREVHHLLTSELAHALERISDDALEELLP